MSGLLSWVFVFSGSCPGLAGSEVGKSVFVFETLEV